MRVPDSKKLGTVLITDSGRGSAIAFIRSLGKRGWRVIAADHDSLSPGFRSRYAADCMLYPDPRKNRDAFVEVLLNAAKEKAVDLIVPITDETIYPLSHVRERLDGVSRIAIAEQTALDLVTNKAKTLQLAKELDIPIPRTQAVRTVDEACQVGQSLTWPVVLKPRSSRQYNDSYGGIDAWPVSYANDLATLAEQMLFYEGRCEVLLQEYCRGVGYGVELLAYEGKPLAAFQHRRLAEVPVTGGASALRESTALSPDLYEYSLRLIQALRWTGLIMIEFKVGARVVLMEINGRVWGSLPLAVFSGVDFPNLLAELYLGG